MRRQRPEATRDGSDDDLCDARCEGLGVHFIARPGSETLVLLMGAAARSDSDELRRLGSLATDRDQTILGAHSLLRGGA